MKALITQKEITNEFGVQCDCIESNYITFFEELNVELIPVSNFQNKKIKSDFLILTGGGEIDDSQANRNMTEKELFEKAISNKTPVIGICRGMQYINIILGGKIKKLNNLNIKREIGKEHKIKLYNNTIFVNNYHNNGIYTDDLAKGLEIIALDEENGIVEGYISKEPKILGLQWHPERAFNNNISKELTIKLIKNFLNGEF